MKLRGEGNEELSDRLHRALFALDADLEWHGWVVEHAIKMQPPLILHAERCGGRVVDQHGTAPDEDGLVFIQFDCGDAGLFSADEVVIDFDDPGTLERLRRLVAVLYGQADSMAVRVGRSKYEVRCAAKGRVPGGSGPTEADAYINAIEEAAL
jgi:hypothetical protein